MLWCLAGRIVNYPFALPDKNRTEQNRINSHNLRKESKA